MKKSLICILTALASLSFAAKAQCDHVGSRYFRFDSLDIYLVQWHTQSREEDILVHPSQYVFRYFVVERDTLFSQLPANYVEFVVEDTVTHDPDPDKPMIGVVDILTREVEYSRYSQVAGRRRAICPIKKRAAVFMSL